MFFQIDTSTYVITYISVYQIQKQVGNVYISVSNNQLYTYITKLFLNLFTQLTDTGVLSFCPFLHPGSLTPEVVIHRYYTFHPANVTSTGSLTPV